MSHTPVYMCVCLVWGRSWGTAWQRAEEVPTAHPCCTSIPEKMSDCQPRNHPLVLPSPSHKVHMHSHAQTRSSMINPPNFIWKVISLCISVWGLLLSVEAKGWRETWLREREWDSVNALGSALVLMGSWTVHLSYGFVIAGVSLQAHYFLHEFSPE